MTQPEIYNYMVHRARLEKQAHNLTVEYYRVYLLAGVRAFFGVEVTSTGKIIEDTQNPTAFEVWKNNKKR